MKAFIRLPQPGLRPISLFFLATLAATLILQGCTASPFSTSSASSSSPAPPDPPVVAISVSPTSASVAATKTLQFTATVSGTVNTAVTWQVSGDATHGTISTSGLYTAPASVPNPASVTITVTSQADSTKSAAAAVTVTSSADTTPPSAPSALLATAISGTKVNLTWVASTDNVGVTGYLVERCSGASCTSFAQIGTSTTANFSDSGLTASTSYGYRVRATDAAGNLSTYSNTASATTQVGPDTTPPTAPTGLVATASSGTQIGLAWTASTDNAGVTGYRVERCSGASCTSFAQIGTSTTANFSDSGLTASTSYGYRVRATDAAGNLSNYSNTASATTSSSGGSNITVNVSPRRGGLTVTQTLSIAATLANDTANAGVSWSSSGGGSFSSPTSTSGNPVTFTAPSSAGVVTITATSVADGAKTATATIGVTDLTGVTTYLNGNTRQGVNLQEFALATSGASAVNSTNFGKIFTCTVDAAVYAQPLWVANLSISGVIHNVVYVATQHNTLYALDADGPSCQNVWGGAKNLNPAGQTWVTSSDVSCQDLTPDIGIVGTPVIDRSTNTLYVVTKSKTTSGTITYHQHIHALDITTGSEKFSGPVEISASVSGNGNGSSGGVLNFDPLIHNQRPALLLENGHVIISWASHCDNGTYHGWLLSYGASTLAQEAVLNLSPNGTLSGIWMSGSGPAADSSGNIYFATGNGTFDASNSTSPNNDYGDSVVKVGPPSGGTFPVLSYFTPLDQAFLEGTDGDQGAGGVLLLPAVGSKNHLAQAGKSGNIYVTDRSSLGGFSPSSNNVVQELSGAVPGGMWGSPTYWNGNIYFGAAKDPLASSDPMRAFSFDTSSSATLSTPPTSVTTKIFGFPGPTAPVSANGSSNGILWALDNALYCTAQSTGCGPAVLHSYDATDLSTELWNSGNTAGNAVKFTVPTVANGKVYVGTRGNNTGGAASSTSVPGQLDVYGLLP